MKNFYITFLALISILLINCNNHSEKKTSKKNIERLNVSSSFKNKQNRKVIVQIGIKSDKMSNAWKEAITNRKGTSVLDSLSKVLKPISIEEQAWIHLIESKAKKWNLYRDSLKVPFQNIRLKDTVFVLLGYQGGDDAFTYKDQTICLDVNTLNKSYGSAHKFVNDNRIDRIFSHEFTHLLHKQWAKKNNLELTTFKDEVLWECVTEGFGMYRSMSPKWFPSGDSLSLTSKTTFNRLYPIFAKNIIKVSTNPNLSENEQADLHANLSRGSMKKKWGALPVAVWLAFEANGNDENLIEWVNMGPDAIVLLAEKYLNGKSKELFDTFLKNKKNGNKVLVD